MTSPSGAWRPGDSRKLYALLAEMAAKGEQGAIATVIRTSRSAPRHSGSKMVIRADGTVAGSVGGGTVEARAIEVARQVMADGQCQRLLLNLDGDAGVCGGETELFIEPVTDTVPLWIVGAGHVGRAVLEASAQLPFRPVIVDDRAEYLTDLEPDLTRHWTPEQLAGRLTPDPRMVMLMANRNHELDGDYLEAVFSAEQAADVRIRYLGVVGSRTKSKVMAKRFGDDPRRLERYGQVVIPAGLSIGAETPAEIALSILAEILAVVRGIDWLTDSAGETVGIYCHRKRPAKRAPAGKGS